MPQRINFKKVSRKVSSAGKEVIKFFSLRKESASKDKAAKFVDDLMGLKFSSETERKDFIDDLKKNPSKIKIYQKNIDFIYKEINTEILPKRPDNQPYSQQNMPLEKAAEIYLKYFNSPTLNRGGHLCVTAMALAIRHNHKAHNNSNAISKHMLTASLLASPELNTKIRRKIITNQLNTDKQIIIPIRTDNHSMAVIVKKEDNGKLSFFLQNTYTLKPLMGHVKGDTIDKQISSLEKMLYTERTEYTVINDLIDLKSLTFKGKPITKLLENMSYGEKELKTPQFLRNCHLRCLTDAIGYLDLEDTSYKENDPVFAKKFANFTERFAKTHNPEAAERGANKAGEKFLQLLPLNREIALIKKDSIYREKFLSQSIKSKKVTVSSDKYSRINHAKTAIKLHILLSSECEMTAKEKKAAKQMQKRLCPNENEYFLTESLNLLSKREFRSVSANLPKDIKLELDNFYSEEIYLTNLTEDGLYD